MSVVAIALIAIYYLIVGNSSSLASEDVVRIGVLTDMSGPLSDYTGPGAVRAAQFAADDFGGTINGKRVEILSADHGQKPDIASSILRRWYDRDGVDVAVDLVGSSVTLAANDVTHLKNKVALNTGSSSVEFYREKCNANSIDFALDNYLYGIALTNFYLRATKKRKWFLLVADYAFGHDLQKFITRSVEENGGTIIGAARHPFNTSDFSSFLIQAESSGADVLALVNVGTDLTNSLKQAREFGLSSHMDLIAPAETLNTVLASGLEDTSGLLIADAVYWDSTESTRKFAERYMRTMNKVPTSGHYLTYTAVTHYLKAVQRLGSTIDGAKVVAMMKELPVSDQFIDGHIRVDGRVTYDVTTAVVKSPSESKKPFDVYRKTGIIPAHSAFAPTEGSPCPLVSR